MDTFKNYLKLYNLKQIEGKFKKYFNIFKQLANNRQKF